MKIPLPISIIALVLHALPLCAQVPQIINYQGRVAVGTVNFEGSGQFKFALVNAAGTTSYWSNDGTSNAGSQPSAAVTRTVSKGLYSVQLGDTTLANMTALPASVFHNTDVRLRVWFNDGTSGFQLLTPDQRITSVGYAMVAGSAATVPDGAITGAKLAAGAVSMDKLGGDVGLWSLSGANVSRSAGNVGIGTSNPVALLQVRPRPADSGALTDFSSTAALLTSATHNGGTVPAPRETVLALGREGVGGEAYANYARFDLSRYEHSSVEARTQLDIRLTHGFLDAGNEGVNTPTIMSLRSNGNVGIGTTAPATKLDVAGAVTATAFVGSGPKGFQEFTTAGTFNWVCPANVTAVVAEMWGAGGGGGGGASQPNTSLTITIAGPPSTTHILGGSGGGGGGGGAYLKQAIPVTPGVTYQIVVGAGGAGGAVAANGNAGGATEFKNGGTVLATITGGGAGAKGSSMTSSSTVAGGSGGNGAAASNAPLTLSRSGSAGTAGFPGQAFASMAGGNLGTGDSSIDPNQPGGSVFVTDFNRTAGVGGGGGHGQLDSGIGPGATGINVFASAGLAGASGYIILNLY